MYVQRHKHKQLNHIKIATYVHMAEKKTRITKICIKNFKIFLHYYLERERGQWAVYYSSPQSFIITFSYLLT